MKKLTLRLSLFGVGLFVAAGMASAQSSNMQKSGAYSANSSRTHYTSSNTAGSEKHGNVTAKVNSGKDMMSYNHPQPRITKPTVTKKVTIVKKQVNVTNRTFGDGQGQSNKKIGNKKQVQVKSDNNRDIVIHSKNVKIVNINKQSQEIVHQNKRMNDSDRRFINSHPRAPDKVLVFNHVVIRNTNSFFNDQHMDLRHGLNNWGIWDNHKDWDGNVHQLGWNTNWTSNQGHWDSANSNLWWLRLSNFDRDNILRFCNWTSMDSNQRIQFMLFWESLTPGQKAHLVDFWDSLTRSQQITLLAHFNSCSFDHRTSFNHRDFKTDNRFARDWHNMFSFGHWNYMRA